MFRTEKNILALASLLLFLAVALGAFGAHGLEKVVIGKYLQTYKTGIQYHYYHGFALLVLAIIQKTFQISMQKPAMLFSLGILLFSFNCYLYAMTQIKTFAMIVPFGGVAFLIGWLLLGMTCLKELK